MPLSFHQNLLIFNYSYFKNNVKDCRTAIPGHPQASRAPLFGVANYGIMDDFQNVIPILKEKTKGRK